MYVIKHSNIVIDIDVDLLIYRIKNEFTKWFSDSMTMKLV